MVATALWLVSMMALAGIVVPLSQQREQVESRYLVLAQARSIAEEIKSVAPETITQQYHANTYTVTGVSGANQDGTVITVTVDATNPQFVAITISGAWYVGTHTETLEIQTEIYSPNGQL